MDYRYLLPVFVGHPFRAEYTPALRDAVSRACDAVTREQPPSERGFRWYPEFANVLAATGLRTVLAKVRALIRESALTVFDITDATNANVFFELGMAVAMEQRIVLLGRHPFAPPSDIRGYEGIEYAEPDELEERLRDVFVRRLRELRSLPSPEQDVIYQKIQIDTSWEGYLQHASDSAYFFAGDVSWADDLQEILGQAGRQGVRMQVCCRRPRPQDMRKWQNIRSLTDLGAEVRMYPEHLDPQLRGFVVDPSRPWDAEAVFVEKQRREGTVSVPESDGRTVGESLFIYKAQIYRGRAQPRLLRAVTLLFESLWQRPELQDYDPSLEGLP